MPHRCAGCKTLFPDARHLRDGCPVCGCGKFVFETERKKSTTHELNVPNTHNTYLGTRTIKAPNRALDETVTSTNHDSSLNCIESIRIIEPGRYDLNLTRLAESDDRVVRIGSGDTYRLDLHSMMREKKKK